MYVIAGLGLFFFIIFGKKTKLIFLPEKYHRIKHEVRADRLRYKSADTREIQLHVKEIKEIDHELGK